MLCDRQYKEYVKSVYSLGTFYSQTHHIRSSASPIVNISDMWERSLWYFLCSKVR